LGGSRILDSLQVMFEERNVPTLLVADSLDEARGADDRIRQADTLPAAWRIVLTSRPGSWNRQLGIGDNDPSRRVGVLQPLRYPEDVEPFITAWFSGQPTRAADLTAQIRNRPALRRTATVPLLLSFYCIIGGDQPLPARHAELYKRVINRMLTGRWRGRYWQCADLSCLRLRERRFHGRHPGQRHILTLAGRRPELLRTFPPTSAAAGQLDPAVHRLDFYVMPFANRWALTSLLRELDEQLAATRDLAERSGGRRSSRALTHLQQQLMRTGMDSQIVAADIVRYAQDEASWRRDILDFNEVPPPAVAKQMTSQASLANTMRQGQISQGGRVTQAEAGLRDLLNTSAQLTAAAENLRLQRRVIWLTIASLIVAAIAAAAAVVALRMSGNTPPATPTPTSSSSSSLRTWTGYVARGQGPPPDRRDTRTGRPGWAATTVDAWLALRLGGEREPTWIPRRAMSYWLIAPGPFRGVGQHPHGVRPDGRLDLPGAFHGRARPRLLSDMKMSVETTRDVSGVGPAQPGRR
jgi:hypothetical protein